MNIGKAAAIFTHIQEDRYTDEEKWHAIRQVTKFETDNAIHKSDYLDVILWMLAKIDSNEA